MKLRNHPTVNGTTPDLQRLRGDILIVARSLAFVCGFLAGGICTLGGIFIGILIGMVL